MGLKTFIRGLIEAAGYSIHKLPKTSVNGMYAQDGLLSIHNHDFMTDALFCKAYERGCRAASDYRWHWRVHVGLWASFTASKLAGDFVECGVNRGFLSSAIMEFLNWDALCKTFYLLDTFVGLDGRFVSNEDHRHGAMEKNAIGLKEGFYVSGVDSVRANFSQWKHVKIIEGSIPETLGQVDTQSVAYLHLDMNCSPPEVAAIKFFWNRLCTGAIVLLDDYAYAGFESQKHAMDSFARENNVMIASLPTGQGLLIRPPR